MPQITTVLELKSAIKELELKRAGEWPALKEKFLATAEMYQPRNIIKTTVQKMVSEPDLKMILLNGALGLTTGIVGSSVLRGVAVGPISKWVGGAIMGLVTAKNLGKAIGGLRSAGGAVIRRIMR